MSTAASLALLKGGKKSIEQEQEPVVTEAAAPEIDETDEDTVTVDVDKMSSKELDALVAEHEIETPDTWSKMKVGEKRGWLKEQFEDDEDEADADDVADAEPAAEPEPEPEPEVAPSPSKAVAKTTKPAKAVKGDVEVPGDDVLSDLVHSIENLKEDEARHMVASLSNETEVTMFKLGGVLSLIQSNGWFQPYATFREYVEKEVGMHYRKATYWSAIYNALAESKVPWEKVKSLGWSKLKEIADIVTLDNVDDWVAIAQSQTTLQLIETVKASKAKANGNKVGSEEGTSKAVTTVTFKVHDDQKATIKEAILKAKEESGTTVDTVALEFICLDYMATQSLASKLQVMGIEAALDALQKAFPSTNFSVVVE